MATLVVMSVLVLVFEKLVSATSMLPGSVFYIN
jgi:hypothetical protein